MAIDQQLLDRIQEDIRHRVSTGKGRENYREVRAAKDQPTPLRLVTSLYGRNTKGSPGLS